MIQLGNFGLFQMETSLCLVKVTLTGLEVLNSILVEIYLLQHQAMAQ